MKSDKKRIGVSAIKGKLQYISILNFISFLSHTLYTILFCIDGSIPETFFGGTKHSLGFLWYVPHPSRTLKRRSSLTFSAAVCERLL